MIINDLDGYYIVFDTKNWNTELDTLINKVKSLRGYISLLTACKKAKEVGEVVATMCQNEEAIDADLIAKKDFIHLLLPFLTNVKTGKGVDNLRLYINNAWDARKKAIRQSNR